MEFEDYLESDMFTEATHCLEQLRSVYDRLGQVTEVTHFTQVAQNEQRLIQCSLFAQGPQNASALGHKARQIERYRGDTQRNLAREARSVLNTIHLYICLFWSVL